MDPEYRTQRGRKDTQKRLSTTARGQEMKTHEWCGRGHECRTSLVGTVGQSSKTEQDMSIRTLEAGDGGGGVTSSRPAWVAQ